MELIGEKRTILGKGNKKVRAERLLPAVIYGKGKKSLSVSVNFLEFTRLYKEAGETQVINLKVDNKVHPVLVKEVQVHHMNLLPIHVSFYEVDLTQKVKAEIPVEIINEEMNPLVKTGEFLVMTMMDEIEVEALPTDFPHAFIVDAAKLLTVETEFKVSDLEFDRSKITLLDTEETDVIAKLESAQMAEEVVVAEEIDEAAALANLEATSEKKPEEEEEGEDSEKKAEKKKE